MEIGPIKPSEMKIENLKVVDFFDAKFIGLLQKKIGNFDFEHFCIIMLDEKREKVMDRIMIGHDKKEDKEKNITTVSVSNTDMLNKVIEVIIEFKKK
jgi:hypothetical protein